MPLHDSASPDAAGDVTIRPATPDDLAAIGRLGAMLVGWHHDLDPKRFVAPTRGTPAGYASFLGSQLDQADVVVLVAADGSDVLGYAYATVEGRDWMSLRGPAGVLQDIIVDPERRRHGVGRKLLDGTVAVLRARGVPQVVLSTATQNLSAQRLFASAGFRSTMIEMTRDMDEDQSKRR